MDGQCCGKLIVPNSNQVAVKRNVWNLFPLDIQLDVFRCLKAYDVYKKAIFVSSQWRNVIEKHKRTLPKFRQLIDCRVQNRLRGDNYEKTWQQKQEVIKKNLEFKEKHREIREKRIKTYVLLIITSSIATIAAQPISIVRTSATLLLLAVSLRMGNAYAKFLYDPYKANYNSDTYTTTYGGRHAVKIFCKRYSTEKLDFLRHVWLAYLGTRIIIFAVIGVLRHIITADNILYGLLWSLYLPEAGYLTNWSFYEYASQICYFSSIFNIFDILSLYNSNIEWLNPNYPRPVRDIKWYSELPIYVNIFAWIWPLHYFSPK